LLRLILRFKASCEGFSRRNPRRPAMLLVQTAAILVWTVALLHPATVACGDPAEVKALPAEELFVLKGSPGVPFRQPTDAALGPSSRVYVLDGLNGRVAVFDSRGGVLFSFGSRGSGQGQLLMAVGIGISPDGRVCVADTGNHRIQVFSAEGKWERSFSLKTGARADPTDVLPTSFKNLCYVCDNDNHEIQAYDLRDGSLVLAWGKKGSRLGEFNYPSTLAMDGESRVYVVDVLNARVQSFDSSGKRPAEVVQWGLGPSGLFRPKGVAVDVQGRILVSDSYMGWVKVFRDNGDLVGLLGEPGGQPRRFDSPTSLATDADGRICVVETRASRVAVLRWAP
jgi:tripartite motif-containing protein 71